MKNSYLISILRYRSILICLCLFFIHTYSFWANDKTQEHNIFNTKKKHFLRLTYNLFSLKILKTTCKWSICSSSVLLYIKMSSEYTRTNFPMKARKTWFINLMKVLVTHGHEKTKNYKGRHENNTRERNFNKKWSPLRLPCSFVATNALPMFFSLENPKIVF